MFGIPGQQSYRDSLREKLLKIQHENQQLEELLILKGKGDEGEEEEEFLERREEE
jgi:hypothetical protein